MNFSLDGDVDQIWGLYQKVNKLINKHAPLKIPSARIKRNLSKPWITKGLRRSIKVKNNLMMAGDRDAYKLYRNKLTNLIRLSKNYISITFSMTTSITSKVQLEVYVQSPMLD